MIIGEMLVKSGNQHVSNAKKQNLLTRRPIYGTTAGCVSFYQVEDSSKKRSQKSGTFVCQLHSGTIQKIRTYPTDNSKMITCGADGALLKTDLVAFVHDAVYNNDDGPITSFDVYPGRTFTNMICFSLGDHYLGVKSTEVVSCDFYEVCPVGSKINYLTVNPDGNRVAGAADNSLYIWDILNLKYPSFEKLFDARIKSVVFSPGDAKRLVVTLENQICALRYRRSKYELHCEDFAYHFLSSSPPACCWHPRLSNTLAVQIDVHRDFFDRESSPYDPVVEMTSLANDFYLPAMHSSKNLVSSVAQSGKCQLWKCK